MSINQLLSTVILVAFIVTLVLAVGSYMAYKARERRRPTGARTGGDGAPVFFERVYPTGRADVATAVAAVGDDADATR
jgi:hypothetical protein